MTVVESSSGSVDLAEVDNDIIIRQLKRDVRARRHTSALSERAPLHAQTSAAQHQGGRSSAKRGAQGPLLPQHLRLSPPPARMTSTCTHCRPDKDRIPCFIERWTTKQDSVWHSLTATSDASSPSQAGPSSAAAIRNLAIIWRDALNAKLKCLTTPYARGEPAAPAPSGRIRVRTGMLWVASAPRGIAGRK